MQARLSRFAPHGRIPLAPGDLARRFGSRPYVNGREGRTGSP